MRIEILQPGDEDLLEAFLRPRIDASLFLLSNSRRAGLVDRGGELVAPTSFNAAIDEAVQVGGIRTPPEHRRRGSGRAAVAVSLLDARAAGAGRAILFTGDDNVGAIKAYLALGFERIGDYRIVLLRAE